MMIILCPFFSLRNHKGTGEIVRIDLHTNMHVHVYVHVVCSSHACPRLGRLDRNITESRMKMYSPTGDCIKFCSRGFSSWSNFLSHILMGQYTIVVIMLFLSLIGETTAKERSTTTAAPSTMAAVS